MGEKRTLTISQFAVIEALLSCATKRDAARQAGVSRGTVYEYLKDPDFVAELRKQQEAILAGVVASIVGLSENSVKALQDILDNDKAVPAVKARVALGWLSHVHKFAILGREEVVEPKDLEEELQADIDKVYDDSDPAPPG